MGNTLSKQRNFRALFWVLLVNVAAGLWLYLVISSSFAVAMTAVAAMVALLIYMDASGLMDRLYAFYAQQKRAALLSVLVIIFLFPFFIRHSPYLVHIAVMICIYSIVALGLNFQMGSTDMVNFACGAFFGMGAYGSALLATKGGLSPWLGILAGLVAAVALAYVVGVPTLKTKGYYLSLVTLALQLVFTLTLVNTAWTGGPNGIAGIKPLAIGAWSLSKSFWIWDFRLPYQAQYFYLAAAVLLLAVYAAGRLHISAVGLGWNAVGEDETAARSQGLSPARAKLLAFCIGGAFSGVAGAIYAHYISFIGPEDFNFAKSLIIISMVILGGADNVIGVVVGAVLLTLIDERLRDFTDYRMLLYGASLLTVLLLRPAGLMPKRVRLYHLFRNRPPTDGRRVSGGKEQVDGTTAD